MIADLGECGHGIGLGDPCDKCDPPPSAADEDDPGRRRVQLTRASGIRPARVRWLWDGRMALGALSLLAGPEGLGKSTLAYNIVAQVTRGALPGELLETPRAVLVAATEDSWSHTIVPRLIAAGADLEMVFRVDVVTSLGTGGGLSLPADIPAMRAAAAEVKAAMLLLDPLTSRLHASLDTHKDSETRLALEPLVAFATQTRVAVLGIMHFNKSGSTDPLALVMASKAFTAVARSVSTVVKDPDDESDRARLFGTVKNNLGRADLPTLRFTITGHAVPTDDGTAWTSRLVWGDEAVGSIGDALKRASRSDEDRSATSEAAGWLSDYLTSEGGTVDSAEAKVKAKQAGHSPDALKRAARSLGLVIESHGFPRRTRWAVPTVGASTDSTVGAQSAHSRWGESPTAPTAPTGGLGARVVQSVQSVQSGGAPRAGAPTGTPTADPPAERHPHAPPCSKCRKPNPGRYGIGGTPVCPSCRTNTSTPERTTS